MHVERRDRAAQEIGRADLLAREPLHAGLELRHLEEALDHPHEPPRFALDDLRRARDAFATAGLAIGDRLREAVDRGERGTQLVRDVGEELLFARARALDLAGHLVERAAELLDLGRAAHGDAGGLIRAECADAADEPAER